MGEEKQLDLFEDTQEQEQQPVEENNPASEESQAPTEEGIIKYGGQ